MWITLSTQENFICDNSELTAVLLRLVSTSTVFTSDQPRKISTRRQWMDHQNNSSARQFEVVEYLRCSRFIGRLGVAYMRASEVWV